MTICLDLCSDKIGELWTERERRERETELIYKRVVKKMRGREREREFWQSLFGSFCRKMGQGYKTFFPLHQFLLS
jgi:hypothetical protein